MFSARGAKIVRKDADSIAIAEINDIKMLQKKKKKPNQHVKNVYFARSNELWSCFNVTVGEILFFPVEFGFGPRGLLTTIYIYSSYTSVLRTTLSNIYAQ